MSEKTHSRDLEMLRRLASVLKDGDLSIRIVCERTGISEGLIRVYADKFIKILQLVPVHAGTPSGEDKLGLLSCPEVEELFREPEDDAAAVAKTEQKKNASLFSESSYSPTSITVLSAKTLYEMQLPAAKWLVEGIIPNTGISFISGKPSVFKSLFAMDMTVCIALKKDFLDRYKTESCNILYADEEAGIDVLQEQLSMVIGGLGVEPPQNLYFTSLAGMGLVSKNEDLRRIIEEKNIKLVVFDSFRRVSERDENKSDEINDLFCNCLTPLVKEYGLSIVFVHHNRKDSFGNSSDDLLDSMRGSSDIPALAHSIVFLLRKKRTNNVIEVWHAKTKRGATLKPFKMEAQFDNNEAGVNLSFNFLEEIQDVEKNQVEENGRKVIGWLSGERVTNFSMKEAVLKLATDGLKEYDVRRAVGQLKKDGKLMMTGKGAKTRYYLPGLWEPDQKTLKEVS